MRVEPAAPEDARAIATVHVASWKRAYKDLLPAEYLASLSVAQREAVWRESLEKKSPLLLVARGNGEVAGFVAYGPSRDAGAPASRAEVWALYLAPTAWSRGVGRMLWLAARERILLQGFDTISLWVIAANERAIRFYLAAGFKPEPDSLKEFELGGVTLQEVRYVFEMADARPGPQAGDRPLVVER
jgi:ribosomal protein S18 acetylase RimI-like enzyme